MPSPLVRPLGLVAAAALLAVPLFAQETRLVSDLRPDGAPFSSLSAYRSAGFVRSGPFVYFVAADADHGAELWRTDGTAAGTLRLSDATPGWRDGIQGTIAELAPIVTPSGQAGVVFRAQSEPNGAELWITDGTPAGTALLADIRPGPDGSAPSLLTPAGSEVYFAANDGVHGSELWRTDGTAAGTVLLADATPGKQGQIGSIHADSAAGLLYFTVGSPAGPRPMALRLGGSTVAPLGLNAPTLTVPDPGWVSFGGRTFFVGSSDAGFELWATDGSADGTRMVVDIAPGFASGVLSNPVLTGGRLYFVGATALLGRELWTSDGTSAGTVPVADLRPGKESSDPRMLTALGNGLAFVADDGMLGREPWFYAPGTGLQAIDLARGPAGSQPTAIAAAGSDLVVAAELDAIAPLAVYDLATTTVTRLAAPRAFAELRELTPIGGGRLMFSAENDAGREPWISDGTPAGTQLLTDVAPGVRSEGSRPTLLGSTPDGWLLMEADGGPEGREPWAWRAGMTAPVRLADIHPTFPTSQVGRIAASTDRLSLFFATGNVAGGEPYVWDRTTGQVTLLADTIPGRRGNRPPYPGTAVLSGDRIVFGTADEGLRSELWVTDGTTAGTRSLRPIATGFHSKGPTEMVSFRDLVVFVAEVEWLRFAVGVTDGTTAGTLELLPGTPPLGASLPPEIHGEFQGELWFTANTSATGSELFRTDGTVAGTRLAFDLEPGFLGSNPEAVAVVGDRMAFFAATSTTGRQLFVSDGTAAGTSPLIAAPPPEFTWTGFSQELVATSDRVYWVGPDGDRDRLWVSDLTPGGTRPIDSGSAIFIPEVRLVAVGERVYFWADSRWGWALFACDGTSIERVSDVEPFGSGDMLPLHGTLYISGSRPASGAELYAIDDPGAMVEDLGDRCGPHWAQLEASAPQLGGTVRLRGALAPANAVGVTLVALAPSTREPLPGVLQPGCWSHARAAIASLPPTTSVSWTRQLPIPASPALSGQAIVLQSYYLDPAAPHVATSNALRATLGR